jgi:hypothetical protein
MGRIKLFLEPTDGNLIIRERHLAYSYEISINIYPTLSIYMFFSHGFVHGVFLLIGKVGGLLFVLSLSPSMGC